MTDALAPCRKCGMMLRRGDHRRLITVETDHYQVWDNDDDRRERRRTMRPVYENIPCPRCGDPMPLFNNKLQLAIFFTVFFAIVFGLLAILLFA